MAKKRRRKSAQRAPTGAKAKGVIGRSTKQAKLIALLERAEGATITEMVKATGWLPHTVRAAITGLRHAGREVTRSKDAKGHSVYRLALAETAPGR